MKGILQLRPPIRRYDNIWDVQVLHYLQRWMPLTRDSTKELTLKLTMVIALVSAQRRQSIHLLNIDYMVKDDISYVFTIKEHIKQSRLGYTPPQIEFKTFSDNPNICIVATLNEYTTAVHRGEYQQLLLSYVKLFKPVTVDTISRWLKLVLVQAGIDTTLFRAQTTHCAAVSKATVNGLHIDDILKTADWSSECTFAKFYNKSITTKVKSFSSAVLQAEKD